MKLDEETNKYWASAIDKILDIDDSIDNIETSLEKIPDWARFTLEGMRGYMRKKE